MFASLQSLGAQLLAWRLDKHETGTLYNKTVYSHEKSNLFCISSSRGFPLRIKTTQAASGDAEFGRKLQKKEDPCLARFIATTKSSKKSRL